MDTPGTPPRVRQRPDPCADDCTPVCPACGGLQCLCRPRFFPGQLLTDEDLNRLERYVVEKNRLHNRYLVGWGVVCGLEVVCDACNSDRVVVRTGYALSPCGDDIVVCRDHAVNICELISQCRPQGDPNCDPMQAPAPRDCRGGNDKWVLAICYDERPSRGVTALLGSSDDPCCSSGGGGCGTASGGGCGCGGPAGGGCGCNGTNGSKTTRGTTKSKKRTYAPQCEPTQICEGYRFIVYPAPKPHRTTLDQKALAELGQGANLGSDLLWSWLYANRSRLGPLFERLLCCAIRGLELRSAIRENQSLDTAAGLAVYEDYLRALREFAADFALHRCAALGDFKGQDAEAKTWVKSMRARPTFDTAVKSELGTRVAALDTLWLNILAECFCSALLPACPGPEPKNCVPLAVITVADDPCRVVEICNWEERKLLITWRTIFYWLSWLPWQRLRTWIAALCCGEARDRYVLHLLQLMIGFATTGLSPTPSPLVATNLAAAPVAAGTAPRRDPIDDAMNAPNLFAHLLADFGRLRSGTEPTAPLWATLAARATDASALRPLAGPAAVTNEAQRTLAALHEQVNGLAERVLKQQAEIDGLRKR
jgi:hypothetical protein